MVLLQVFAALALLAFIGVACISSVHAHAPAPAPVHHKPVIVKECNDVCKDKCFQDVQKKCFDVPYQEQVRPWVAQSLSFAGWFWLYCMRIGSTVSATNASHSSSQQIVHEQPAPGLADWMMLKIPTTN